MRVIYVSLSTVKTVQAFVVQIASLEGQFDFQSEGYILDAKSLMGILRLDISKPLRLIVERDTEGTMSVLRRFIAEGIQEKSMTALEV